MHNTLIKLWIISIFIFSASIANEKPNFVFILSDDQAWTDYGFMGHKDIKTPHLDALAKRSLVFERGYVAAPLCRPSLATMITGLYPLQHGITGNDVNGPRKRAELDIPVRKAFHKLPSIIRLLSQNGYLTHQSGKWWEGSYQDGGFTHGMTHGNPKKRGRHGDEGLKIGREGIKPITDFIDMSVEQKKPFFIWYAPFLPHTPHNPPARFLDKYKEGRALDVANYYAMCEWFDETCGELLSYIDKKQLKKNTVVIYICDNGWAAKSTNKDDNQKLWKGYALRSKSSPYENGIRTPIMIAWPDKVKAEKSKDFGHAIDLFPTIASIAGIEAPGNLPGINLLDKKAREDRKSIFGVTHSVYNMTLGDSSGTLQYLWCIDGDWKILVRFKGSDTTVYKNIHIWDKAPVRLYNIKVDPHEKNDLAEKQPDKVKTLKAKVDKWYKQYR